MYLESLEKVYEPRPALNIEPIQPSSVARRNKPDCLAQLSARANELASEMGAQKRKVQISKSVEYPPDFKPSVELIKTHYMGVWRYPEHNDTCAICRESLAAMCVICRSQLSTSHECTVHWGTCKHVYHGHCIKKWIEQRNACPICQHSWVMVAEESPLA